MTKGWVKRDDTCYVSLHGYTFQREYGKTPNGNDFNGRWVYRDSFGRLIDFDTYRYDLASRHKIVLDF